MDEEGGAIQNVKWKPPPCDIHHCDGLGETKPIKKLCTTTPAKIVAHLKLDYVINYLRNTLLLFLIAFNLFGGKQLSTFFKTTFSPQPLTNN